MASLKKEIALQSDGSSPIAVSSKKEGPRFYQQEAIDAVLKMFKTHDRTHAVMACGTGKSRVGLWVAENMKAKQMVVFVPSLALISQLLNEWMAVTSWTQVSCLAICCDKTVTRGTDNFDLNPQDCDFPVTTDATVVTQFLQAPFQGVKMVFCTYQSSSVLSEATKLCNPFDIGIFDEAHKTAGKNTFGLALHNKNVEIKHRFFMTATPKHYDINHQNTLDEASLVYSMDDETIYGPRAYTLSFRKAIQHGIICDYKVIISVIEINYNEQHGFSEILHALTLAAEKERQISKIITFHPNVA